MLGSPSGRPGGQMKLICQADASRPWPWRRKCRGNRPREIRQGCGDHRPLPRRRAVKNLMAPNIPLALVLLAVAAVALRAAARRPEPPQAPGTGPAPAAVMAGQG